MTDIYYDPYDFEIDANPHPVWRRMRDEAPLYRNDKHEFWALSRYQDVAAGLTDWKTYSSARSAQLEPRVRAYCARSLDPLVGSSRIDFIADLGSQMPMRVIGMLLGIPEEDQEELRDALDAGLSLEEGESPNSTVSHGEDGASLQVQRFSEYIAWRRKNPS